MTDIVRKVVALLSPSERRQASLLFGMILIMAFLDVVGIASIMPFMAVLANPDIVHTNSWLHAVYTEFGFDTTKQFLFFLGVVVFVALVVSVGFKAGTTWAISHFGEMRNYSISRRLVAGYLSQPYEWFLNRHSADLGKSVLSEAQLVVQGALMPLMQICVHGTVIVAILAFLVIIDPFLALIVGFGMGGLYGVIFLGLRRLLERAGKERVEANAERYKMLSEVFGGIKEVKLGRLEQSSLSRFDVPAKRFASMRVIAQLAGMMPRYAIEIIAFGGMLLLVLYLMDKSEGLDSALAIIALYGMAGYRLLPALQMAYQNSTQLRFSSNALDKLHADIQALNVPTCEDSTQDETLMPLHFVKFDDVTYRYPGTERAAVDGLNLAIPAKTTVGLVGATGSGKTTAVDIMLGLLEPESGTLSVDGAPVTRDNLQSWQRSLGYVPQQIFLADESIVGNIAFGVPTSEIDYLAVKRAAEMANLHQFIIDELPQGYDTLVGERGVRLSGGQRQRIGIARALYHQPKVLILDEATSALDNLTEQAVMDAVHNLGGEITIVMIAHRLTTVRECECIYVLENGSLIAQGTYTQLSSTNAHFRALAGG